MLQTGILGLPTVAEPLYPIEVENSKSKCLIGYIKPLASHLYYDHSHLHTASRGSHPNENEEMVPQCRFHTTSDNVEKSQRRAGLDVPHSMDGRKGLDDRLSALPGKN